MGRMQVQQLEKEWKTERYPKQNLFGVRDHVHLATAQMKERRRRASSIFGGIIINIGGSSTLRSTVSFIGPHRLPKGVSAVRLSKAVCKGGFTTFATEHTAWHG